MVGVLAATGTGIQSYPAVGIDQTTPGATNLVASNQIFGPYTGTLAKVGDSVVVPAIANGCGTYFISIVTASGDTAFQGTFASSDSVTGGSKRLIKTGVGALQVASATLNGTQGNLEYRTTGGVGGQAITCTAWTAGRATVLIWGVAVSTAPFINGAVETTEGAALRASRAFTAAAMAQIAGGSLFNFLFVNATGSNTRAIFNQRRLATDNPSGQIAAKYYSLSNPTINLPTTAATARNRANFGPLSSAITCFSSTSTASATANNGGGFPDTSTSTPLASRIGGILPTGGFFGGPEDIDAIVDPGSSVVYSILSVTNSGTLASTNPYLSFLVTWVEEPLN